MVTSEPVVEDNSSDSAGVEQQNARYVANSKRRLTKSNGETNWVLPDVGSLENRYGSSVLDEFVLGHDTSDIVTELIQNEFDAEGNNVNIVLGTERFLVTGNGKIIDSKGWKRLSVVLGTGETGGQNGSVEEVTPKENGIGSKNFGLRSLFLLGDQIYVRSGGKFTMKDRFFGSPSRPRPDPDSKDRPGIEIHVPYRNEPSGQLKPFTIEREAEMLDGLIDNLHYTVVKLSLPKSKRNIQRVEVTSERLESRIVWKQKAEQLGTRKRNSATFRRTVQFQEFLPGRAVSQKIALQELEFTKTLSVPEQFQSTRIPIYFGQTGKRVRIGVSLRLSRGRINLEHDGLFFYPLGLRNGLTGTAISVNAPFILDQDRSRILDDEWNNWLLDTAADLTIELLNGEWRERFGPEAFLALRKRATPANPRFLDRIDQSLANDPCWPTRSKKEWDEKDLRQVSELVILEREELDGFLEPYRYLNESLNTKSSGEAVRKLASEHGAKSFSISSLIRLRCAGGDNDALATQVSEHADFKYSNYEATLKGLNLQIKFGKALDGARRHLTNNHKKDLRNSHSTLAADGSLKAAKDLVAVDPALGDGCPVPLSSRLHPSLMAFRAIKDLCKPFEENRWAMDVGARMEEGSASSEEREALYRLILSRHGQLRRTVIARLKTLAVLKDHRGNWVAPSDIMPRRVAGAREFEPILHFPHSEYARDRELETKFGFRQNLAGIDLVSMANLVISQPDMSEGFEVILQKRRNLLARSIVTSLKEMPFLRSSTGVLDAPENLYLRDVVTEAALGDRAEYVLGNKLELYKTLGCREFPSAEHIIGHLKTLEEGGGRPNRPEILYPALVSALNLEAKDPAGYATEPIVWTEKGFQAPSDILIGSRFPRSLRQAVPNVRGPKGLVEALQALGAHAQPSGHHWGMLLSWIAQKYGRTGGPVTNQERIMLRDAYARRGLTGLSDQIDAQLRCLLGQDRMLYSLEDVNKGHFVVNDNPELAEAIVDQGAQIGFADNDEGSQLFFRELELRPLTRIMGKPQAKIGQERNSPSWFDPVQLLDRLHSKDFASALAEIGRAHARFDDSFGMARTAQVGRRLAAIDQVVFVHELELEYRVRRTPVSVKKEAWLEDGQLSMVWFGSRREVDQLVAHGLTKILSDSATEQQLLVDSIYCLLTCQTSSDMKSYLRRRGIQWTPPSNDVNDGSIDEETESDEASEDDNNQALIAEIVKREKAKTESPPQSGTPPDPGIEQSRVVIPGSTTAAATELPQIESVSLQPASSSGNWTPPDRSTSGGGGGGNWTPRTPIEAQNDELVGLRGEELVFDAERKRVKELGFDESRVVWTAKSNRTADHDIKSVHEDGGDLWIEVKATSGRDGRFSWSIAEFGKAAREQDRYELWRVYEASSNAPSFKKFPNPVSMHENKKIKLELASFWAEVEPMNGQVPR